MSNFWHHLKNQNKPILALAPMAEVTDAAFRELIAKYGKPDVTWTEFVSCDGLMSEGRERLLVDLRYTKAERPIVAQVFGSKPENYYKTAQLCQELGFDGIDINMGCPDKAVNKQGSGVALVNNPELAKKIILETKRGAGELPVSVKTRMGWNADTMEEWSKHLLETEPAALTMHLRTKKEMSKVPAHWERMPALVELARGSGTLILGNGDVLTIAEAEEKCATYGCDGVMLGRAIFGNPWLFNRTIDGTTLPLTTKLQTMLEHAELFHRHFHGIKPFIAMRKSMAAYLKGYPHVKNLRLRLMAARSIEEVREIVKHLPGNTYKDKQSKSSQ